MQIRMQASKTGAVEIRMFRPFDPGFDSENIWIDQYSGKVIAKLDPHIDKGVLDKKWTCLICCREVKGKSNEVDIRDRCSDELEFGYPSFPSYKLEEDTDKEKINVLQ